MKWHTAPLREVAPPEPAGELFGPTQRVWILTLDQIESGTGRILNRRIGRASEAGNSTFSFDTGNVLYSKLRPYLNKVVLPDEQGIATTELVPLRPHPEVLNRVFLAYYLRSREFLTFAQSTVAGVKMPRLIMDKLWEHRVPLPPVSEQRRIVEILDQADALRRQRAEADTKAERILPAVFYRLFGDPATNPRGWPVVPIGELGEVQGGLQLSPARDGHSLKLPYLRVANVYRERLDLSEIKLIGLTPAEEKRACLFPGDLLVVEGHGNPEEIGRSAVWHGEIKRCVHQNHLIRIRPNQERILPIYLSNYLNSQGGRQHLLRARKTTSGLNTINVQNVRNVRIPVPPIDEQHAYANRAEAMNKARDRMADADRKLNKLFGGLLHRAFSGSLTAKWRQAHKRELLQEMEAQARALRGAEDEPDIEVGPIFQPAATRSARRKT